MTVSQTKRRTMANSTHLTHFILSAYFDTGHLKYLYFMIVLLLYVLMLVSNVLLIVVICVNRSLHEPMYLFLCSLFVNELFGSTGIFPSLLTHILTDIHTVSASLCFLQISWIHFYGHMELLFLAVMSYDRYFAICHPLQYNTHTTKNRIVTMIIVPCFYCLFWNIFMISLSSSLQLCGNITDKVYCDNYPITRLACSDITAHNIFGLIAGFVNILSALMLILYSYMRIFKVCFSGSKQTRHKAVSTCTPHLASLINFILGASFEIIQSKFNMNHVPGVLRIFLSLYFLMCQPLFNLLMYGLNISKIRSLCKWLLWTKL
ncbi:olfactory receptor 10A6-like [Sphaeramia orbicularis]|uniref:olfactory receptor 10A6-like n=1 Tax=Sphaeramia orbicularis TaxID=375764 RepID=UPI00117F7A46|nr:olfactory receptor 10A6-like [Sphaeramia orbicularis]